MQANVDKIIEAAEAVNRFDYVADEIFDENDIYPACVVGSRESSPERRSEAQRFYIMRWKYEVFVLIKKEQGWENLEQVTMELLTELTARDFLLESWEENEMLISGRDILVSRLNIEIQSRVAFL